MRKVVTGYCPETDCQQTIAVDIERIHLGGGIPAGDKIVNISCRYAQDHVCHYAGRHGRDCPVAKKAHS